jgi:hypothetical protein
VRKIFQIQTIKSPVRKIQNKHKDSDKNIPEILIDVDPKTTKKIGAPSLALFLHPRKILHLIMR